MDFNLIHRPRARSMFYTPSLHWNASVSCLMSFISGGSWDENTLNAPAFKCGFLIKKNKNTPAQYYAVYKFPWTTVQINKATESHNSSSSQLGHTSPAALQRSREPERKTLKINTAICEERERERKKSQPTLIARSIIFKCDLPRGNKGFRLVTRDYGKHGLW